MENIDSVIERLVAIKGSRPGTLVQLSDKEAFSLVAEAQRIVEDQPVMLEVQAPLQIVGDIHGQYPDLLRLFEFRGMPPDANYLFLGDYVDRGANGLECMFLLMALKIKHPEKVWLLRGNHECAAINRIYGFHDECKRNGGVESGWARGPRPPAVALIRWWWPRGRSPHVPEGSAAAGGLEGSTPPTTGRPCAPPRRRYSIKLWKSFQELFNSLPLAAVVDGKIFCIHGGLSPDINSPSDLKRVARPVDVPDTGMLCDTLWSDPDAEITGWAENDRGVAAPPDPARSAPRRAPLTLSHPPLRLRRCRTPSGRTW